MKIKNMKINVEEFLDEIEWFYFHENEVRSEEQEVELETHIWEIKSTPIDLIDELMSGIRTYGVNKLKDTHYK